MNRSGNIYGLTILSPILDDPTRATSHLCELRDYLARLPRDSSSPFAKLSSTHMARLVVMDDVVYVGAPACEEHLNSRYLVFETNFDGSLDAYLNRMANETGSFVEAVWGHCHGFPKTGQASDVVDYLRRCQIDTSFFFAAVAGKSVDDTLRALRTQSAVAAFIEKHQGKSAADLQHAFARFVEALQAAPPPERARTPLSAPFHVETKMNWAARHE